MCFADSRKHTVSAASAESAASKWKDAFITINLSFSSLYVVRARWMFLLWFVFFLSRDTLQLPWEVCRWRDTLIFTVNALFVGPLMTNFKMLNCCHSSWVLLIAKVVYFFLPSLPNVEWPILGPLPFFFHQKLFIFRFLENCFWGPNLHNAVG